MFGDDDALGRQLGKLAVAAAAAVASSSSSELVAPSARSESKIFSFALQKEKPETERRSGLAAEKKKE